MNLFTSKIMQLKFEMARKFFLVSPNDPTNSRINETIFMSRTDIRDTNSKTVRIDTFNSRNVKTEFDAWCCKRTEKCTGCSIDMNGNRNTSLLFIFIEELGNFFNWLIVASISGSENNENSYPLAVFIR